MPRPTRPTDADAFADLPSPDEYAANGYRLKPLPRFDRERAAWCNREQSVARAAIAVRDTAEVRAARLLVGGIWLDGPFRPVWITDPDAQLGWLSDAGVYVDVAAVQARDLDGLHRADWLTHLAAEPAEDCELSGAPVHRDDPNEPLVGDDEERWWCHVHETDLPTVTVDGQERVAEHDRRGRLIENGRTIFPS